MLMEKPKAAMIAKVPSSTTGIAIAGIRVARQLWRNTSMIRITSAIASMIVSTTASIEASTKGAV